MCREFGRFQSVLSRFCFKKLKKRENKRILEYWWFVVVEKLIMNVQKKELTVRGLRPAKGGAETVFAPERRDNS